MNTTSGFVAASLPEGFESGNISSDLSAMGEIVFGSPGDYLPVSSLNLPLTVLCKFCTCTILPGLWEYLQVCTTYHNHIYPNHKYLNFYLIDSNQSKFH